MPTINQRLVTNIEPAPGLPATILYVTDRYATEIAEVSANGRIVTVTDTNTVHSLSEELNEEGFHELVSTEIPRRFSLRADGRFIEVGQPISWGTSLLIGVADSYRDPSF